MTRLIIDASHMEVTGKFDSRKQFLRVTSSFRDAYFSKRDTFAFNEYDTSNGQIIAWRYRNGPVQVVEEYSGVVLAPAISNTSVGVTF